MRVAKQLGIGSGGVHFSKKCANWLLNQNGDYSDAIKAMSYIEHAHNLLKRKYVREVQVWD